MPIVLPGEGGIGGGGAGGLTLGPPQNQFSGDTRAEAVTARNNYATANASWLAQYDAEPTFTITLSWPTANPTDTIYQSRRGGSWADVTGLLRGPAGTDGVPPIYQRWIFQAADSQPSAPTAPNAIASAGDIPGLPSGWFYAPPDTTQPIWASLQTVPQDRTVVTYTAPDRWDGADGSGGGLEDLVVRLWASGEAWRAGELANTARGSMYVAQVTIPDTAATSSVNPDDATNSLWRPVQGFAGSWTSGGNYRAGNLVEHMGRHYLVIVRVSGGTTSPDGDTTNYQLIGNQNLTDAEIGEKAFENPPSLSTSQQAAVRTAIGAGPGTNLDDLPIPSWVTRGSYVAGELVRDPHNRVFMCITDILQSNNAPAVDFTHFRLVTGYGGNYADNVAYPKGSLVSHGTDAYFVISDVPATNTTDPDASTDFLQINGGGDSGTTVEANPDGEATDSLLKIGIDGTVYSLAAGDGGSGGGTTTLYEDSAYTTAREDDTWYSFTLSRAPADNALLEVYTRQDNNFYGYEGVAGPNATVLSAKTWKELDVVVAGSEPASSTPQTRTDDVYLFYTGSIWNNEYILCRYSDTEIGIRADTNQALGFVEIREIAFGGGGSGTTVEANPSGAVDSGALTKLDVDGSIYSVGTGTGGTVSTDATLTGDGASATPLSVANPFTSTDEAVVDAIVQDVIVYWVPSSQHAVFDAVSNGDTIDLNYGTGNADTVQATVRAISRATNIATVIIDPLTVWSAIVGGSTVVIEDSSNNTIGTWQTAGLQTTRAGVNAANEWWRQERAPGAGADVWAELDRIDALDDTHLTLGTRTATTLEIASSTGNNVTVPSASRTQAGLESAANAVQLAASPPVWVTATAYDAGVQRMWQGVLYECILARTITDTDNPATDTTGWAPVTATGTTDLSVGTRTGTTMVVESSSGSDVTLPAATTSDAGLETAADKAKSNALPDLWSAAVWSAGDQCTYSNVLYVCLVDRTAADTDTPDTDSSSWAPLTGNQDLSDYVTTTTLASYTNTTGMNTAIANAIANLDAVVDKGAWNTTDSFDEHDFVRHSGASYVALGTVNAGIEPGVTPGWTASWYRLAYSDGPPTALTTPSLVGDTLDFPSISGHRTQIKLPSGTETPFAYYVAPTLAPPADSTSNQAISDSGDGLELTILDDMTFPAGILPGVDFVTEWEGNVSLRLDVAGTVVIGIVTEHTINGKTLTHVREVREDYATGTSLFVPFNVFNSRSRVVAGTYGSVTLTEADLEAEVQITYKLRFQLMGRRTSNRIPGNISEIFFENLETVSYQLGAFRGSVDTAPATRAERVTFQAITSDTAGVEGTPISTDPVSVVFPEGAERSAITALNGSDITLKAGVYLVSFNGTITGANNQSRIVFRIRDASDDSSIAQSTSPHIGQTAQTTSAYTEIILHEDTAVNVFVGRFSAASEIAANWTVTFTRWGGSNSFDPDTLGVDTFGLTGAQQDIALTDDTSGNAIACPETGWLLVKSLIPGIGLNNRVDWYFASDLRADKTAAPGLYTNTSNEIILRVAAHEGGATTDNKVTVFWTGATSTGGVTPPPPVTPHIRTFRVTGDKTVPANTDLAGRQYSFESQINQSSHVAAARIVGFIGTAQDPQSVTQLHVITDFSDETGTITLPSVTLTADQVYTLREEVYETGKTFADTPTVYSDYRITAVAASLRTHFGYILATQDETNIEASGTDISTSPDAAGNWTVTGLPPGSDWRMFWRVPTANTQPTTWVTSGFDFSSTIETAENVSIGGASYTVYMTEADSPFDSTSNGTILVVS